MKYHLEIISMFTPFLENPESKDMTHALLSEHAKDTRILAAKEIAQCFRTLRRSYGYEHIPSPMLEAAYAALLVIVTNLGMDESDDACVELCQVFVACSKRFKQARDMIQKIQSFAQKSGIVLPSKATSILNE